LGVRDRRRRTADDDVKTYREQTELAKAERRTPAPDEPRPKVKGMRHPRRPWVVYSDWLMPDWPTKLPHLYLVGRYRLERDALNAKAQAERNSFNYAVDADGKYVREDGQPKRVPVRAWVVNESANAR
jgi:hypothetical protein